MSTAGKQTFLGKGILGRRQKKLLDGEQPVEDAHEPHVVQQDREAREVFC